jgi:hypothetical protein
LKTFHSSWRKEVMTSAMGTQKWLTLKEQVIGTSVMSCHVMSSDIMTCLLLSSARFTSN